MTPLSERRARLKARLKARMPRTAEASARRLARRELGWTDYGSWAQQEISAGVFHFYCPSAPSLCGFVVLAPALEPTITSALAEEGLLVAVDADEEEAAWVGSGAAWLEALCKAFAARKLDERLPERQRLHLESAMVEQPEAVARFLTTLARHEAEEIERQSKAATPKGPRSRPSAVAGRRV